MKAYKTRGRVHAHPTRWINGFLFHLVDTVYGSSKFTKEDAENRAESFRQEGNLVRVIKQKKYYAIYVHEKEK